MEYVLLDMRKNQKEIVQINKRTLSIGEIYYVRIDERLLKAKGFFTRMKAAMDRRVLKKIWCKTFLGNNYYYLLSHQLTKHQAMQEVLEMVLDTRFEQIKDTNTIRDNSMKYLKEVDLSAKVLLICSTEIKKKTIINYIDKFKFVDFLYLSQGVKNGRFLTNINTINEEYGTYMSCIATTNLEAYDTYVLLDKVDLTKYILKKKAKTYLLYCSDEDIYSQEYGYYTTYQHELLDNDKYSKTKLGRILMRLG